MLGSDKSEPVVQHDNFPPELSSSLLFGAATGSRFIDIHLAYFKWLAQQEFEFETPKLALSALNSGCVVVGNINCGGD